MTTINHVTGETSLASSGGLKESGGQVLTMGAISDGQIVKRTGTTLVGAAAGSTEGTAVLSTGEAGGTKFLRENGDGTCSWETVAGGSGGTVQGTDGTYDIKPTNEGATAGNSRGENSVDLCTSRSSVYYVCAGAYSGSLAGDNVGGTGTHTAYLAGKDNFSNTGNYCSISGYNSNGNSGSYCLISGSNNSGNAGNYCLISGNNNGGNLGINCSISGYANYSNTGDYCSIHGYNNGSNSGDFCSISGSYNAVNAGDHCLISGFQNSNAGDYCLLSGAYHGGSTGSYSVLSGYRAANNWDGTRAHASGYFATVGDAQTRDVLVRNSTTDATQTTLYIDGTTKNMTVLSGAVIAFDGTLVAARTDAAENARWTIKGLIENVAGTTTLLWSSVVKDYDDSAAWSATVVADDTSDTLLVKVTGESAKSIKWVAHITTTEVGDATFPTS